MRRMATSEWFDSKLAIADHLAKRNDPPAEFEAEIILCCALGALSSLVWPGKGTDKKRFVQFLVDFSPNRQQVTTNTRSIL